ncbi:hypothetical protein SAY87_012893 [Trapa incisa]|uniref:Uncharacterized protein n=1 Tax=Trapa incisa TaxID=236973 RepID=A0AAN7KA02_9MYRT|nr:hypothetical protein SAY87_012893 [Trapa incisa]
MATKSGSGLSSTLVLLSAFLTFTSFCWLTTRSDDPCPYPCNPPPTGAGGSPFTPTPPKQTGSYYPPPAYYNYLPPPAGYIPNYQPPLGGRGGFYAPPSPDPILPYYPFYFKGPLHGSSAAAATQGSTMVTVMITGALVFLCM